MALEPPTEPATKAHPNCARGTPVVRPMNARDVKQAAALHAASLPHGFFPRLGRRFLREYYRTFVASPHAVALAVGERHSLDGLLVGLLSDRDHYRWVLRARGWRLSVVGTVALVLRPWLISTFLKGRLARYRKAVRSLWSRDEPAPTALASPTAVAAVLAHIAVRDAARGAGAGTALVDGFLAETEAAGVNAVCATTLDGPSGAARFYERIGWHRKSESIDWDGQRIVVFHRPTRICGAHSSPHAGPTVAVRRRH